MNQEPNHIKWQYHIIGKNNENKNFIYHGNITFSQLYQYQDFGSVLQFH